MGKKIKVGVLGATGAVGQKVVRLLDGHPWFEVAAMSGSARTTGKSYGETLRPTGYASALSTSLLEARLVPSAAESFSECKAVFSALPADAASELEPAMARAGLAVISNASAHRPLADVPLVVPEVNGDHLGVIARQKRERGWSGCIVTNPNCSTIVLTLALAPLHRTFGIEQVFVTTLQAVSGAGFNGVGGLDIIDNVVPYIGGEEDKVETEPPKILGSLDEQSEFVPAPVRLSAQCTRVPTTDGHLEMVSIKLGKRASAEEIIECWREWKPLEEMGLPSAPPQPVVVRAEVNRPQPRLDRDEGNGMAAVVGRLRPCPLLDYKFALLGHNLVRGAAGGVVLIAELMKAEGLLS